MEPVIHRQDEREEYYFAEGCYIIELCNDGSDPELSIARARVRAGRTTRWHSLDGTTERYVIVEGTGCVEVGDLSPAKVSAGDVVLIPPGVRQRITNTAAVDLVFLALCTPPFRESAYRDLEE